MTRKELQEVLNQYPEDMQVKSYDQQLKSMVDVTDETIIISADTAHINDEAPEDEWDMEDGKFELGDGERYILINAIVL